MIWQDIVFLVGNVFSLVVLVPTLRDEMANVPLGTALRCSTVNQHELAVKPDLSIRWIDRLATTRPKR